MSSHAKVTRQRHLKVKAGRNRAKALFAAATVSLVALVGVAGLFTIGNADASGRLLMVSSKSDRSDYKEMAYSTLSGNVYIFVKAVPKTTEIQFFFDKNTTPVSTETSGPWDLATTAADGKANAFNIDALGAGKHTIHYKMTYNGKSVVNNANFTVASKVTTTAPPTAEPTPTVAPTTTAAPAPTTTKPEPTTTKAAPTATATTAPPTPGTSGETSTATNLDESGRAIPDTSYAIPDRAVFMATSGSDSSAGTLGAPVKSLNKAVSLAPEGGTVVVRGGTYRDSYGSNNAPGIIAKGLTFQAYPHEQVWFDGTDVVASSKFTSDGNGHWFTTWNTPSFCSANYYHVPLKSPSRSPKNDQCAYWDSSLDTTNPMAVDPQMVFADGSYLHEVSSLSEATGNAFYYAQDTTNKTGRIYLGFNPAGRSLEVTARSTALVLRGAHSRVLGIGFKRYATNVLGSTTTGAVYNQSIGALFENVAFVQNAGPGFSGSLQQAVVRHSLFVKNGANGIVSNGHMRAGTPDNSLIENSLFSANNAERFDVGCTASCGAANIKLNHMVGFTVRDNIIQNSGGSASGVWCDLACTNGVIVRNLVQGNGGHGIFYEVSDSGIIASNLVRNNSGRGISLASANTKVFNNTLTGQKLSMNIYDDGRSFGVGGWTDVGPDTRNIQLANNVVSGSNNVINCGPPTRANAAPNTGCSQFFSLLDFNSYQQTDAGKPISFKFTNLGQSSATLYKSISAFHSATGLDAHSSAEPTAGALRAAAVADEQVTAIPSDVAKALGLTSTNGLSRGAIVWPGK